MLFTSETYKSDIETLHAIEYIHIFGNTKAQYKVTQVFLTIINLKERQRKDAKQGLPGQ